MVDLDDLKMHQKMVAMFAPEVLEEYALRSVKALEESVALLLSERVEITRLVHQAFVLVAETHQDNQHISGLREARDVLCQVKLLTGT
jgi:hypothetical protein